MTPFLQLLPFLPHLHHTRRCGPARGWRPFHATVVAGVAMAVTLLNPAPASADPMRPLASQMSGAPSPAQSAAERAAAAAAGAASTPRAAPLGTAGVAPLVAIRQDSSGQRLALLGTQWLKVGERFSDATGSFTVLGIAEHHIEIQRGQERRKAYLLPPLLHSTRAVADSTGHSKP